MRYVLAVAVAAVLLMVGFVAHDRSGATVTCDFCLQGVPDVGYAIPR